MNRAAKLKNLQKQQHASLGYLLIRCGQLWNEQGVARVNAEAGKPVLRDAHTRLLPHLQADEGVRITELASLLSVTKQAVQPLVADLAQQGIVTITTDPVDARARRVTLTAHGIAAIEHGTGVLRQLETEVAPKLGKAKTKQLKKRLAQLLAVLESGG